MAETTIAEFRARFRRLIIECENILSRVLRDSELCDEDSLITLIAELADLDPSRDDCCPGRAIPSAVSENKREALLRFADLYYERMSDLYWQLKDARLLASEVTDRARTGIAH